MDLSAHVTAREVEAQNMSGEVAAANPLPLTAVRSGPKGEHAGGIDNGSLELEECFPLLWKAAMNNLQRHTHHKHRHFQILHSHSHHRD